jgi:hypothetical protein
MATTPWNGLQAGIPSATTAWSLPVNAYGYGYPAPPPPYSPANASGSNDQFTVSKPTALPPFQAFQQEQCQPTVEINSAWSKTGIFLMHPFLAMQLKHKANQPTLPQEGLAERVKMYSTLNHPLSWRGSRELRDLRKQGILDDNHSQDGHSTLYHLYAIATTPKAAGYDPKKITEQSVDCLDRPEAITQKFKPLSEAAANQLLALEHQAGRNTQRQDLDVQDSATCVDASVQFSMSKKEPSELARQLNELFSPMNAFFKHAKLSEISPNNPGHALELLQQNKTPYLQIGPDEVLVQVTLQPDAMIRTIDAQHNAPHNHAYRNAVETAYQSALMHLATSSYNAATDMRDSDQPGETSKGLTEEEKASMEAIIKSSGAVQSVTYQVVDGKPNAKSGEEGNSYLYGYGRSFTQTATDLVNALNSGHFVIVGLTDTDPKGLIVGGHEITLTKAFQDKDGELKFLVADSDDNMPKLVVKTARELIPQIHHAGFPLEQARQINSEIAAVPGYMVPEASDAAQFKLLQCSSETPPNLNAMLATPPPPYSATPTPNTPPFTPPPAYATIPPSIINTYNVNPYASPQPINNPFRQQNLPRYTA